MKLPSEQTHLRCFPVKTLLINKVKVTFSSKDDNVNFKNMIIGQCFFLGAMAPKFGRCFLNAKLWAPLENLRTVENFDPSVEKLISG